MGLYFFSQKLELHSYAWISEGKEHQKYIKSKTLYRTTERILQ
jgi:hypothetical protein